MARLLLALVCSLTLAGLASTRVVLAQGAPAAPAGSESADSAPGNEPPAQSPPVLSEREAHIEQGVRFRQEAKDEQALAAFERAAALGRDGRVLAQIAFAEQAMGRWADSYLHLKESLADAGHPWVQQHGDMLREELKKIEANIGRLEVRTNVAVSKLTIDSKQVDVNHLGEPFIVPAGSVVVSAEAPGYLPTTRHVPVYAGSLSRTELVLVNEPTVLARQRNVEERSWRNPIWLYVAGAGALVSIASVGPWVAGNGLYDTMKSECSEVGSCLATYDDDEAKVRRLDRVTNGLLFGGLSVAALSTASYFLFPQKEKRVTVTPSAWLQPGSFGLGARVVH